MSAGVLRREYTLRVEPAGDRWGVRCVERAIDAGEPSFRYPDDAARAGLVALLGDLSTDLANTTLRPYTDIAVRVVRVTP